MAALAAYNGSHAGPKHGLTQFFRITAVLSVIIPANNEEALLGACLESLLASDSPACCVEIVVVANGCKDKTAEIARQFQTHFEARGWRLKVLELVKIANIDP